MSFIVPAACLGVVGIHALYDLRARPRVIGGEIARPVVPVGRARPAGGAA